MVVIDESIELAKKFGTDQSGAFVNGILDALSHRSEGATATEPGVSSEPEPEAG